ncbi:MAG: glycosyltransferase [Nitrospirae bacterium]|nr:glycosyltransferase [Nitrospirota bacterium]
MQRSGGDGVSGVGQPSNPLTRPSDYPFLEPGVLIGELSEQFGKAARNPSQWSVLVHQSLNDAEEAGGARILQPLARIYLFALVSVAMRENRAQDVDAILRRYLLAAPDDFLLLYLHTTLCNFLGCDSSDRQRLLHSIADAPRPEAPGFDIRPPRCSPPRISIAISTWNRLESLGQALDALRHNTRHPYEVIVYDNASTDGSPRALRNWQESFPQLGVISSSGPRATSESYNLALRAARGDIVGFLADDVEVAPDWDIQICDTLSGRAETGAAHSLVLDSAGRITFSGTYFGHLSRKHAWINGTANPHPLEGTLLGHATLPSEPWNADVGAYLFMRRDVFEQVHVFDTRYSHYWGDYDASYQIRGMGLEIKICPQSRMVDLQGRALDSPREDAADVTALADLFYAPERVLSELRAPTSAMLRCFRDRLLFESKWFAYRNKSRPT